MYISDAIKYSLYVEAHIEIDGCENIWIKILGSNVVIGTIYRHPRNDVEIFLETLNKNLENLKNNKVFLVGDFNINLDSSSGNISNSTSAYVNMLTSNGYYPLIHIPTRVTDVSSTVIDHIMTNDHTHNITQV